MRIKQTAWKNSVGVRVLLVWQRDCHHIKIARVLNKTETCTIYTCQREEEAGRQRRPDTENFHSRVGAAWCEVQELPLHVRLNFVKWHVRRVHMTEALNVVLGSARWVICIQERLWNVEALKKTDPCDPGQEKKRKKPKCWSGTATRKIVNSDITRLFFCSNIWQWILMVPRAMLLHNETLIHTTAENGLSSRGGCTEEQTYGTD